MAEYLDMNAKPAQMTQEALSQDPEEEREVKFVLARLEEGTKAREEFDKDWPLWREFYKGKQFRRRTIAGKPEAVFNISRSTIQSTIPILTDARPGFNIGPKEPRDYQFADMLSKACGHIWEQRTADHTLVEALMDSQIISAGIWKIPWNRDLEDGLGDVDIQCINPDDIFVPKFSVDFNKNCPWVIHRTVKSVGELRKLFPDKADAIQPDGKPDQDQLKQKTMDGDITLVSPVDQKSKVRQPFSPMPGDEKLCEVLECWVDSEHLDEYEEFFEGKSEEPQYKKKYPNGKLITVLPQQRLLLQAVENPYSDGQAPFVRFVDTILPRQFWGEGEIEPLMDVQKMINKVLATIMDWMNMHANAPWLNPSTSGLDPTQLTNAIAAVYTYQVGPNGEKPERVFPQPLPPYVAEMLQTLLRFAETISGIQEVSQGRKPTGVTAAQAIDTLQEAAQTRIRLKERNLQTSLSQAARLIVSRILQFWTTPRMIKVTGQQEWPEFFEFHVQDVENNQKQMLATPYQMDPATQTYQPQPLIQSEPSKGMFDISVESGTALPTQKAERGNLAFKLYEAQPPAIDQEALLDAVEIKDKDKILRRMQEREVMAQQAALQAAQGAPNGPNAAAAPQPAPVA